MQRPKCGPCSREELLLLAGDGLAGPATGARIGAGALAAHRQAKAVTPAAQAADVLKTLERHALLATQIAFKGVTLGGTTQLLDVGVAEVLDAGIGIDACFGENLLGSCQADAIHIGEGDFDPLVARNIDSGDPCHVVLMTKGSGNGPPPL